MAKFVSMMWLTLWIACSMLQAQANRLAVMPFEITPPNTALNRNLVELTAGQLESKEYYQIISSKQVEELLRREQINLDMIYHKKQQKVFLNKIAKHCDYVVIATVNQANANQLGINAKLLNVSSGSMLKSTAAGGNIRNLRFLTKQLTERLLPSRKSVMKEILEGYQASYKKKEYQRAIQYCDWGISLQKNYWKFYYRRAKAFEGIKRYDNATKDYLMAKKLNTKDNEIKKDLHRIKKLSDAMEKSRQQLLQKIGKKVERISKQRIDDQLKVLIITAKGLKKQNTDKFIRKAIELQKDHRELLKNLQKEKLAITTYQSNKNLATIDKGLKKLEITTERLENSFRKKFAEHSKLYFSRAMKFYQKDHMEKALKELDKTLLLAPNAYKAHYWHAIICGKLKDYPLAINGFDQAIKYKSDYWEAYFNRGMTYHLLKKRAEALKDFQMTMKLQPKQAQTYYYAGKIYQEQDLDKKAVEHYSQAIAADKRYVDAYLARGQIYDKKERFAKARQDYEAALKYSPELRLKIMPLINKVKILLRKDSEIYAQKAQDCFESGNLSEVLTYYRESIKYYPDNDLVYFQMGYIYYLMAKNEEAIKNYDEAISLKPKSLQYYYFRAICFQKLKEYDKAINDLNITIKLNSFHHKSYHRQALIFEEKKQYNQAMKALQKALQIAGNKAYYHLDRARLYQKMGKAGQAKVSRQQARSVIK